MKAAKSIFLILFVLVVVGYGVAAAQGTNYSGTWVLDKAKSDLQGRMNESLVGITLVVTQDGNNFTGDFQYKYDERDWSDKIALTIGGAEVEREGRMGRGTMKSKASWDADKKNMVLVSESTFSGQNGTMTIKTTDTYVLDGSTMTIKRESESPRGTRSNTLVFDKQ